MCLAIYLGSNAELETSEFDLDNPAPYVGELYELDQARLRAIVGKQHIYYVGADTDCGCGFGYDRSGFVDKTDTDEAACRSG